ncbi:hypothetical protein GW931_02945 [archaeon]|nr:hypothetical protein [archaeon]
MKNSLFAIIVENPEVPNSSDFLRGDNPITSKSIENSKSMINAHIFDMIDLGHPLSYHLNIVLFPGLEKILEIRFILYEKKNSFYKEETSAN